jgi:hypothetical protein
MTERPESTQERSTLPHAVPERGTPEMVAAPLDILAVLPALLPESQTQLDTMDGSWRPLDRQTILVSPRNRRHFPDMAL